MSFKRGYTTRMDHGCASRRFSLLCEHRKRASSSRVIEDLSWNYTVQRTLTENNICDDEICEDVEYYMRYLLQELESDPKREEAQLAMKQVDLVLEIKKAPDGKSIICGYYFANHRDRCLFWLDEFDAEDVLSDCKGIKTIFHKGGWLNLPAGLSNLTACDKQGLPFKHNTGVFY
jgi:hypothetical protein